MKLCTFVSTHIRYRTTTRLYRYHCQISAPLHRSDIESECLDRYRPGGFHPLHLGDILKDGRYEIVHKLGWGGFSTNWAAKDHRDNHYVAIKVVVSDAEPIRELKALNAISNLPNNDSGWSSLRRIYDYFTLNGPNGIHGCLVLELLGPCIADLALTCRNGRLPAKFAKHSIRQVLQGLDFLSRHNIGHGDLHTKNLAVAIPQLDSLDEKAFFQLLGTPETFPVKRADGKPLDHNVPLHVVEPASFHVKVAADSKSTIKIIDFGGAFLNDDIPNTLQTPISVRPPEVVFGDTLDKRVDLWSAGCLIFELVTGLPPFSSYITPPLLVHQLLEFATSELPVRWKATWEMMQKDLITDECSYSLREWLDDMYYYDGKKTAEFTGDDLEQICMLVASMLQFEPHLRATASDVLSNDWLQK